MIYGWGVVGSAVASRPKSPRIHDIKCYNNLDTHVHIKSEATICLLLLNLDIYHALKTCQRLSDIMSLDVATWSYMKPHCLWTTFFSIFSLL